MRPLAIISEMCDIINMLSDIVKKAADGNRTVKGGGKRQRGTPCDGKRGRGQDGRE